MARDSDGIVQNKWASTGDVSAPAAYDPDFPAYTSGWDSSYSQSGGPTPQRRLFNWIFRTTFACLSDINTHGLLEWNSTIAYDHPALVLGSDNRIYLSVQDSTNQDPTTDSSDSYWKLLIGTTDGTISQATSLTAADIPDLDASKITSGTFNVNRIPGLNANKIASGVFASTRIPNLNASRITSGTLSLSRIPDLPASQTTSGTFHVDRIPNLPGSKVTGTVAFAQMPTNVRRIWISNSAPQTSDGADGDVWLEY